MIETIHILGIDYAIVESSQVVKDGNYGELVPDLQQIRLSPHLADALRRRTILHEVIEGIDESLGLNLPHGKITALAAALHQVLSDNPELVNDLIRR